MVLRFDARAALDEFAQKSISTLATMPARAHFAFASFTADLLLGLGSFALDDLFGRSFLTLDNAPLDLIDP
jgi:hypothetical protein